MGDLKVCEYGCKRYAHFQLKNGRWCCEKSPNKCPNIRLKNSEGLKRAHKENKIHQFNNEDRSRSHKVLRDHNLRRFLDNPYKVKSSEVLYNNLIQSGREYKCELCGISNWQSKSIRLEIDHINGQRNDNRLENLRFICPNCHSQTDTFRGRNINKGRFKVSDEEILEALKTETSIRKVLLKVGLTPKGSNYNRINELIIKKRFCWNW